MVSLPASQCWMYVRNNNSALIKRREGKGYGIQLTAEKGNVMNKNTFKYSGLANEKTIAIDVGADGKVTMGLKAPKNATKPAKSVNVTPLHKNFRRVAKSIKTQTAGKYYRGDLTDKALARWTALNRYTKVVAGVVKKAKTKTGRKGKN